MRRLNEGPCSWLAGCRRSHPSTKMAFKNSLDVFLYIRAYVVRFSVEKRSTVLEASKHGNTDCRDSHQPNTQTNKYAFFE